MGRAQAAGGRDNPALHRAGRRGRWRSSTSTRRRGCRAACTARSEAGCATSPSPRRSRRARGSRSIARRRCSRSNRRRRARSSPPRGRPPSSRGTPTARTSRGAARSRATSSSGAQCRARGPRGRPRGAPRDARAARRARRPPARAPTRSPRSCTGARRTRASRASRRPRRARSRARSRRGRCVATAAQLLISGMVGRRLPRPARALRDVRHNRLRGRGARAAPAAALVVVRGHRRLAVRRPGRVLPQGQSRPRAGGVVGRARARLLPADAGHLLRLDQEDWPRAEQYLTRLARTERGHKRLDVMVHHFFRSWYSLGRGDARTALAHAEAAWPVAEAIGSMFHKVIVLSALGPARVASGGPRGRRARLPRAARAREGREQPDVHVHRVLRRRGARARARRRGGARQAGRAHPLREAPRGFPLVLRVADAGDAGAAVVRAPEGIHPDIARASIRQRRIPPPKLPPPGWPMPVRIEASDGLVVKLDAADAPAAQGEGRAQAPGARRGARGGAQRRDAGQSRRLAVARRRGEQGCGLPEGRGIHRVRQWLGSDAVLVENGCVRLDAQTVDCDLWHTSARPADVERVLYGFDAPPIRALRRRLRAR